MYQILLTILTISLPVLLVVAFLTLAERQIMASMQRRQGPNVVGVYGLLQAIADGLKLGIKEPIYPFSSTIGAFIVAPMISFLLSQISFSVLFLSDSTYQGLILMSLSTLAVYGVLLAGWSSNSKYAFLGCLRSVSLMVSYELGIGASLLSICLFLTDSTGMKSLNFYESISFSINEYIFFESLNDLNDLNNNLNDFNNIKVFSFLPLFIIFCICILAESKRIPFDLPEAEAELVSGYNVEYSSLGFALFFIAEYASLIVLSALCSIYFLGGFTAYKVMILYFGFVWIRGTLPRYRTDTFMRLGWKTLLPLSLAFFSFYASFDFIV